MNHDAPSRSRLAGGVRYGAVALIAAWSLLALAAHATVDALSGLAASLGPADGWIAWGGGFAGQAGGSMIVILWTLGTLFIIGALAVFRRFAA